MCLSCGDAVGGNGALCPTCWERLEFIAEPCCVRCGYPFAFETTTHAQCGICIQKAPVYDKARAVLRYTDTSRALVTRLKYGDQTQLAPSYGAWLAQFGRELIADSDVIIPVPLHYRRFVQRRYNQSALLGDALQRACGLPMIPDGLLRMRATKPQVSLRGEQRLKNVRGAFTIHPKHRQQITGKRVLLIDDMMTTSATVTACTQALRDADVFKVNVLTLARKFS